MREIKLFRTSFLSGLENILKIVSGLVIVKLLAIYSGPEGLVIFGQFQNLYAAFVTFTSGMLITGVAKYSSQFKDDNTRLTEFVTEAIVFSLVLSLLFIFVIWPFSDYLSLYLFGVDDYSILIRFMLISLIPIMISIFYMSLMNGVGLIGRYVVVKMMVSITVIVSSVICIYFFDLDQFFYWYVICNALAFFYVFYFLFSSGLGFLVDKEKLSASFNRLVDSRLIPFFIMAVISVVSSPVVISLIRGIIVDNLGVRSAGYWEATTRLTEVYLLVVTGALITYYMPVLARCKSSNEVKSLVYKVCIFALVVSLPASLLIYSLRMLLIDLFLDESFYDISQYFFVALVASIVKVLSWVFSYYIISKSKAYLFASFEIIFGATLVSAVFFMVPIYGLMGYFYASLINSLFFLCGLYCYFYYDNYMAKRN